MPSSSGGGPRNLGQGLLVLGALPLVFAGAILGGSLAASLWSWLAIPGGLIGLALMVGLLGEGGVLCGVIETLAYAGVTFVFTGGLERPDPATSWLQAGIVAVVFVLATWSAAKSR